MFPWWSNPQNIYLSNCWLSKLTQLRSLLILIFFHFRFSFSTTGKFRPIHSRSLRPNFCPTPLLELDPFRRRCHTTLPARIHRSGPLDLWTRDLKLPRSPTWYERLQVQRGLGPGDPGSWGRPRKCYRFISRKTHRKRSLKTLWWRFGGCCQCIESCPQQTSIYVTGEKKHVFDDMTLLQL